MCVCITILEAENNEVLERDTGGRGVCEKEQISPGCSVEGSSQNMGHLHGTFRMESRKRN